MAGYISSGLSVTILVHTGLDLENFNAQWCYHHVMLLTCYFRDIYPFNLTVSLLLGMYII